MRWAALTALLVGLAVAGAYARAPERVGAVAATRTHLEAARAAVARGDWTAAEEAAERAAHAWRRAEGLLAVVAAHGDLVLFDVHLAQLRAAVRQRSGPDAARAAAAALAVWARLVSW